MKLASSCFRIARSFPVFSQLRKTNAAALVLLVLMACPFAHATVPAKYAGIEKTVSTAVANPQAVAVDSNGVVYIVDPSNHQVLKETPSGLGLYHDGDRDRGKLHESGDSIGGGGRRGVQRVYRGFGEQPGAVRELVGQRLCGDGVDERLGWSSDRTGRG